MTADIDLLGLLIATLGGTAVGLERQWSGHAEGPTARFAGIRTFTMLGAVAGLAGLLWSGGMATIAAVLVAGAALIVAIGYASASRHDVDATTEVAALVVIAAGVLAGTGAYRLASGMIAITSLLLVEKSRVHAFVERLDDVGLRAAVHFGVMALVILPLLPEGPFGPLGGIRPRELWALVLFFSGLSFLGYVARRVTSENHGYLVAGVLGGMVSSTSLTLTFARSSRSTPSVSRDLAYGAIAGNAVLYPRVLLAVSVLQPSLLLPLALYLVWPAAVAAGVTAWALRRRTPSETTETDPRNPLQLRAALQMAVLFQAVLMLVHATGSIWGQAGVLTSAALLGLTDVDALTMSMARSASPDLSIALAALAIAVGILSNTVMKCGLALALGDARFRRIAGGVLALMTAAAGAAIVAVSSVPQLP